MSKKDLMLEVNKIINELAINGDTLLKNYVRLQNKTNEIKECEEIGNMELSLKYKQQTKELAEIMVSRKERLKRLVIKLDELIKELEN
jgi:hypothetical protein